MKTHNFLALPVKCGLHKEGAQSEAKGIVRVGDAGLPPWYAGLQGTKSQASQRGLRPPSCLWGQPLAARDNGGLGVGAISPWTPWTTRGTITRCATPSEKPREKRVCCPLCSWRSPPLKFLRGPLGPGVSLLSSTPQSPMPATWQSPASSLSLPPHSIYHQFLQTTS